eukprot:4719450-Lingulodinium_polyedra.AAC.1
MHTQDQESQFSMQLHRPACEICYTAGRQPWDGPACNSGQTHRWRGNVEQLLAAATQTPMPTTLQT